MTEQMVEHERLRLSPSGRLVPRDLAGPISVAVSGRCQCQVLSAEMMYGVEHIHPSCLREQPCDDGVLTRSLNHSISQRVVLTAEWSLHDSCTP